MNLFIQGHSASSAYAEFKRNLKDMHPNNFVQVASDRSICPDYRFVFNYFWLFKYKSFGRINSPEAFQLAIDRVTAYNQKHQDTLCKVKQVGDHGDFVVAYVDHLNRRVHECVPASGDIVMTDATSNLDRQDSKYIRFVCPTSVGGLPLGFCIVSSERTEVLVEAYSMFNSKIT